MLDRLLPRQLDNRYRGHKVALWIFGVVTLMKLMMSVNSILNGRTVATSADGIPLDSFTPAGARAVVSMFAAWGLAHLMIGLLCVLVLARYRAVVPFMFAFLLVEHLSRRLIFWLMPIARVGTPPGIFVNLGLLALMVAGVVLSLGRRETVRSAA